MKKSGKEYTIAKGDGAFYGPKIDILMEDVLGREWQMGTIQLDFQQPRRFKLEYTSADGSKKTPIAIHRVIYGSLERFIGILIEHTAGAFPLWLAPVQVSLVPVSDKFNEYAGKLAAELRSRGLRVEIDERNESVGKKIREAEMQKAPYILVVGEKEKTSGSLTVRRRGEKEQAEEKLEAFIKRLEKEIKNKK